MITFSEIGKMITFTMAQFLCFPLQTPRYHGMHIADFTDVNRQNVQDSIHKHTNETVVSSLGAMCPVLAHVQEDRIVFTNTKCCLPWYLKMPASYITSNTDIITHG